MDKTKKEAIKRWLQKAENDLRTSETMISVEPPVNDIACFHAQQCMEKCLKAFLTASDRHIEKTHSLPRLIQLCREVDNGFEELTDSAVELTEYVVTGRYPDDWREISFTESAAATRMAKEAMEFVRNKMGLPGEQKTMAVRETQPKYGTKIKSSTQRTQSKDLVPNVGAPNLRGEQKRRFAPKGQRHSGS